MAYTKQFTTFYPTGWKNRKDSRTTPATAEVYQQYDDTLTHIEDYLSTMEESSAVDLSLIADTFVPTKSYYIGDIVSYENKIYKCVKDCEGSEQPPIINETIVNSIYWQDFYSEKNLSEKIDEALSCTSLTEKGQYLSGLYYMAGNVCYYKGSFYQCLQSGRDNDIIIDDSCGGSYINSAYWKKINLETLIKDIQDIDTSGGGGSGTSNYEGLSNKPQIAGVTLSGNKTLSDLGIAAASSIPTQTTVSGWGFTKNTGTVTGVKINGSTKSPSSGVVDLGTVITSHQSLDGLQSKLDTQTAYTAKGSATKVPQITTNELGQVVSITEVSIAGGGSGGGVTSYDDLDDKPAIAGTTLTGDLSLDDLGIAAASAVPSAEQMQKLSDLPQIKTIGEGLDLDENGELSAIGGGGISNSNIYSTLEKKIGTWINGKPIYKKSYHYEGAVSSSGTTIDTVNNFDMLINGELTATNSSKEYWVIPQSSNSEYTMRIQIKNDGTVQLRTDTNWSNPIVNLTIYYTKTIDEAENYDALLDGEF